MEGIPSVETLTLEAEVLTTFPLFMHKVFGDFAPHTGSYRLNGTQIKVMMVVHIHGAPHMTKICYHMNMKKGSLTPVVEGLIGLELVSRRRNPRDRRRIHLSLTHAGRRLVRRIVSQAHDHLYGKLRRLAPEEIERFKTAIHDLHGITTKL